MLVRTWNQKIATNLQFKLSVGTPGFRTRKRNPKPLNIRCLVTYNLKATIDVYSCDPTPFTQVPFRLIKEDGDKLIFPAES